MATRERICAVALIFRHGDRTPTINCFAGASQMLELEEEELWTATLPPKSLAKALNTHFPVKMAKEIELKDIKSFPFGILTEKGVIQLMAQGNALVRHNNKRGIFSLSFFSPPFLKWLC